MIETICSKHLEQPNNRWACVQDACSVWRSEVCDNAVCVLLLPHEDEHLNALLRVMFTARLGDRCGLVAENPHARNLLELYSLYAFTDKLIVGSFDLPHGRKLRNLLDAGLATEEELINDVILGAM
jgi:hypothetical protein